jgi:hypothetical protein
MNKNTNLEPYGAAVVDTSATPSVGNRTKGNTEVTPRGTASDTHHTSIQTAADNTRTMSSGAPHCAAAHHVNAANAGPEIWATRFAFMLARIAYIDR